jgi:DMSO reductase family type II enzyme heme b subunit
MNNVMELEVQGLEEVSTGKKPFYRSPLVLIAGAFMLAMLMWAFNFQPVSSESTKLTAMFAPGTNLMDFNSPVWQDNATSSKTKEKIATTVVPLSGQFYIKPYGGNTLEVKARAAHDGKDVAFWLQWKDETLNATGNTVDLKDTFSDGAALEFPLDPLPGRQPFRCMGQPDALVNIWHWKAERDAEIARQLNTTPIKTASGKAAKNYVGPNAAYLIDPSRDDPDSAAKYDPQTKTWTLIFKRALETSDRKTAVIFRNLEAGIGTPGSSLGASAFATQIAFAIWDGGAGEKLSKKAVSTWVDLTVEEGDPGPQQLGNLINMIAIGGITIIACFLAWKLLPGDRRRKSN